MWQSKNSKSAMHGASTLILGLGNEILSDDGIGPRLVHDLSGIIVRPDIRFDIASCGGLELMEFLKGFKKVILIDAIRTVDGKPGDVYYFKTSDFRETCHLSNLHDISFLTALKLGKQLELELPADFFIIAVEILEDMEFSKELTQPLKKEYPVILEKVNHLIETILKD